MRLLVRPLYGRTLKRRELYKWKMDIEKASISASILIQEQNCFLAEQVSTIDKTCLMEKKGSVTDMGIMAEVTKALQVQIGVFERYN